MGASITTGSSDIVSPASSFPELAFDRLLHADPKTKRFKKQTYKDPPQNKCWWLKGNHTLSEPVKR